MNKQKQIEEMAEIIFNSKYKNDYISPLKGANELYNAGYRKIPENAVVILDEEIEEFAENLANSPQMQKVMEVLRKSWQKETAEKFAKKAKELFCENGYYIGSVIVEFADRFCKEFTEGGELK